MAASRSASWGPSDRVLRTSPVLSSLQHEELSELLVAGRPARLRRGGSLLRPKDDLAAFVLRGTAVAAAIGRDGQPVVVDFLGPGALTGLPVVLGQPDAGLEVTALAPLDGLLFPGGSVTGSAVTRHLRRPACAQSTPRSRSPAETSPATPTPRRPNASSTGCCSSPRTGVRRRTKPSTSSSP